MVAELLRFAVFYLLIEFLASFGKLWRSIQKPSQALSAALIVLRAVVRPYAPTFPYRHMLRTYHLTQLFMSYLL
jgi:hypothetical protein